MFPLISPSLKVQNAWWLYSVQKNSLLFSSSEHTFKEIHPLHLHKKSLFYANRSTKSSNPSNTWSWAHVQPCEKPSISEQIVSHNWKNLFFQLSVMPRGPGDSDVAQQSRALEKAVNAFPKVQKSSPLTDDCKILPFLLHTTGSQSFYRATNVTSLYWCQVSHETGNKHRPNCYILRTRWSDGTKQLWPFAEIVNNSDRLWLYLLHTSTAEWYAIFQLPLSESTYHTLC